MLPEAQLGCFVIDSYLRIAYLSLSVVLWVCYG